MPTPLPLTSERLERHGLFLIEDGQTIFLWVGRDAVPQLILDVFDLPNYEVLRGGKVSAVLLYGQSNDTCAYKFHFRRRHFRTSTIHSRNASTPSSKRPASRAEECTIPICMLSRRMASHHYDSGHLAVSFKIVRTCCRVISSLSTNSRTKSMGQTTTEALGRRCG